MRGLILTQQHFQLQDRRAGFVMQQFATAALTEPWGTERNGKRENERASVHDGNDDTGNRFSGYRADRHGCDAAIQ